MSNTLIKVSQKHQHVIVKNAGGLQGKTGSQGPQGEKGDTGDKGDKGDAATIAIGQTTTLPAGSNATVNNIGTPNDAVFSFGIPKGDKGDRGEAGAGLVITGSVATYADLPNNLGPSDAGKAYFVQDDGKLYVWTGTAFPADGQGTQFEGPEGPQGQTGPQGFSPIATVSQGTGSATISITDSQGTTTATIHDGTTINVNDSYSLSTTEPYSANYINTHTAQGSGAIGNSYQPVYLDNNNELQAGQSYADAAFVGQTLSTPTDVAYVATQNIQDGAVTADKADFTTYSTTPVKVGTWIDGKELWRVSLTTSLSFSANTPVSTSIDTGITSYSQMVKLDMRLDADGAGQTVDTGNFYNTSTDYLRAFFRTNTIQIRACATQASTKSCVFTVYYTKPTS